MNIVKRKFLGLIRRIYRVYYRTLNHNRLTNKGVAIISNNCWGGYFYYWHKVKFNTPTINLFFMADDYIKFVKNFNYYMGLEMKFTSFDNCKYYKHFERGNQKSFPIGILDDIQIMFMHYNTEKEALDSWERRKKRINYNNILFKFNDQNLCTDEQLLEFDNLPLKNKLIFTVRKHLVLKNAIYIEDHFRTNFIDTSFEPIIKSGKNNIVDIINSLKTD